MAIPVAAFDDTFSQAHDALTAGAYVQAAQMFGQCTQMRPDHPDAWFMLGASLDQCGKSEEAAHAFGKTEALDANHPQAANALAAMLYRLGRSEEALAAFRRALALNPGDAQILVNIGILSEISGQDNEALACYDTALNSDPDHLGALNNRGVLLLKLKRPQQALADHLHFIDCAPDHLIGHYNCAETYTALDRIDEAIASCDAVLKREPGHVKTLFLLGALLSSKGRFSDAGVTFNKAARLNPQEFAALLQAASLDARQSIGVNARNIYCLRGLDRLIGCDWRDRDRFMENLEQMTHEAATHPDEAANHASIPFPALALPLPQSTQLALARLVAANIARHHPTPRHSLLPERAGNTAKIRIGYVSPDFQNHAVGYLIRGLFRQHDRQAFTVHAYSLRHVSDDPIRQEIIAGCDVFRDVADMTTPAITELIRHDGIDILIDLAGYTIHARPGIFAARPAPLNIVYLGYPGTSGADYFDYFVTNRIASPEGQVQFFSEKMIYLPDNCFPYPQNQYIPPAKNRSTYSLPQDAFVFCCFNSSYKIEPVIFRIWMRLLQRQPNSILWLHASHPSAIKNLSAEAIAQGIDPARLVFAPLLPLPEHLARYKAADLFLDTFLYGAGTTGMDALWAGLPLLTCPGESYVSRFGASHLTALGMPELITGSHEEYEERAFHLATHPAELQAIRQKLAVQRLQAPLFRTDQLIRQLERGYKQAWNRHQAGLSPAHIAID